MKVLEQLKLRSVDGVDPEPMFTRFLFDGKEYVSIKPMAPDICPECDGTHVFYWEEFKAAIMQLARE